jgi:hypothetical protein
VRNRAKNWYASWNPSALAATGRGLKAKVGYQLRYIDVHVSRIARHA